MTAPVRAARARAGIGVAALGAAAALLGTAAASPAEGQASGRIAILDDPDGTAVAVSVLLSAGVAWEPTRMTGASYVAAQAALEEVAPQFRALAADATATCLPGALRFTLLAPATTWRVATEMLLDALFGHAVGEFAIEDARSAVLRQLERERGNPEYEIAAALRRALYGDDGRWARPACGEAETISALTPEDVRAVLRARFVPSRAAVAVSGPVDPERARSLLADALDDPALPLVLTEPAADGARETLVVERNTVSSWIGIAYPLPDEVEPETLRLLGREIEREFASRARHPDIHAIRTAIERHGDADYLLVYMVTVAQSADERATQVRDRIRELGEIPLGPQTFAILRRDFLGARLRALATPEARARDAVHQMFYLGRYAAPAERITDLTTERLRRAAATLGSPTTAVIGPR